MRSTLYSFVALLCISSGCGRGLHLDRSAQLGSSSQGTVIVETWFEDAPLACPIWKVCVRPNASTNSEILFTVQSVFQESEPGYPHLVVSNGAEVVQDSAQSYSYSLSSRQFITNAWSGDIYLGDYKQKK